jgi:hypothetical protein
MSEAVETKKARKQFEDYSVEEVASEALDLFPDNQTQQLIHIARHASMTATEDHNPKIITINIVGEGGFGKTGSVKEYQDICSNAHGEPVMVVKRTVGGLIDIESLTGQQVPVKRMVPDPNMPGQMMEIAETQLAVPNWFPKNPASTGILLLDDYNRGVKHVIQGLMDLINEGSLNDLQLPKRWVIVLTSNPEDGDYEVTAMDYAQRTRTINVSYSRREEELKRQAHKQGLHDDVTAFIHMYPEAIPCKEPVLVKPKVNDRLLFLYARLYPYLKKMPLLAELVRESTFETGFIARFEEALAKEQPVPVKEVLTNMKAWEKKVAEYADRGRFDLLNITCDRVLLECLDRDLEKKELENLQIFLMVLSEEKQFYMVGKLVHSKRQRAYLGIINPQILQQMQKLNDMVKKRSVAGAS